MDEDEEFETAPAPKQTKAAPKKEKSAPWDEEDEDIAKFKELLGDD
jgi:hypothetical protein